MGEETTMMVSVTKYQIALVGGAAAIVAINASAQAPADQPGIAFDVVSIRHSRKDGGGIYVDLLRSGLYTARNMPLDVLIKDAYGSRLQFVGAPDWMNTARFDISAKTTVPNPGSQYRQLLRSLLADRFKLQAHLETRDLPIYALVMARSDGRLGPLFRPAQGCEKDGRMPGMGTESPHPDRLPTCGARFTATRQEVGNGGLEQLIVNLPSSIDRPVLDRTGLTGRFDWDVQWESDPSATTAGVSIFSALQEQLGLKLEPSRGPVEVLVIDHVEQPVVD